MWLLNPRVSWQVGPLLVLNPGGITTDVAMMVVPCQVFRLCFLVVGGPYHNPLLTGRDPLEKQEVVFILVEIQPL